MAISTTFTLKFAGAAVERGLARVQSAFKSLSGVAMKVGKSLLSPFAALTALLGTGALVGGLVSFVKGSSAAAASVEDLTIQLEVLTGSYEKANKLIKQFREEEKKSALNLEDYSKAAKTILAFGGTVEDIMPTLRMLGDVSMGNSDRFGSLALAFAQTTAAGRLMGQEVLQFVNAGFNPLEQISRDTGRSMKDLKKDMEDGAISVAMVRQAFINATSEGGRFFRAIDKGSAATNAKINQFGAAITELKVAFGEGFNIGLKNALDRVNEFLPQMLDKFKEFGLQTGKIMIQLMDAFEQGRLGEVLEAALMAGVTRAGEEMIAAMVFAGNALYDTIAERMKGSELGKLFNAPGAAGNTPIFNDLPTALKLSSPALAIKSAETVMALNSHFKQNQGSTDTYQQTRKGFRDAFGSGGYAQILRQTLQKQGNVPNAPGYRYAQPGEPATMMGGERVVRILESIDLKLSPQP